MRFRPFLALADTLAALLLAIGLAHAEPALWVARNGTATVYLFGTVHILKDNQSWRTQELDRALAAAQDLWLEVPEAGMDIPKSRLMQYAMDPDHPLASRLSEAQRSRLDAIARSAGLGDTGALGSLRPWAAALVIGSLQLNRAGYDRRNGVELILRDAMTAAAKPIRGLETVEEQLGFFAAISPTAELEMLDEAMDDMDAGPTQLDAIVAAWQAGDLDGLSEIVVKDIHERYPAEYRALVVNRNVAWAGRIEDRLRGSGVSFIAVGVGHLVGPDSLQVQLARHGVTVERDWLSISGRSDQPAAAVSRTVE